MKIIRTVETFFAAIYFLLLKVKLCDESKVSKTIVFLLDTKEFFYRKRSPLMRITLKCPFFFFVVLFSGTHESFSVEFFCGFAEQSRDRSKLFKKCKHSIMSGKSGDTFHLTRMLFECTREFRRCVAIVAEERNLFQSFLFVEHQKYSKWQRDHRVYLIHLRHIIINKKVNKSFKNRQNLYTLRRPLCSYNFLNRRGLDRVLWLDFLSCKLHIFPHQPNL